MKVNGGRGATGEPTSHFVVQIGVFQKQPVVRTNRDKIIFVVGENGWDRKSISDVLFSSRKFTKLSVKITNNVR